ncbi:MAG: GH25 family lysozyme [Eubacteriales bacterium]
MKRKVIRRVLSVTLILITTTFFMLFYNGILKINNPSLKAYPVRGIDVSSYQGVIDWGVISKQDISFAFIKATEGSTFVDNYFTDNFHNAIRTNLRIGAYHFFSFDSDGVSQADNFISNVLKEENLLPPVVDIEFYANKEANPPDKDKTQLQLKILLEKLEAHYGRKPIIYTTNKVYKLYIAHTFDNYDIWIRDVLKNPAYPTDGSGLFGSIPAEK